MADDPGSSVEDDGLFETLQETAARGGRGSSLEDRTRAELEESAREAGIDGGSDMSRDALIAALRDR